MKKHRAVKIVLIAVAAVLAAVLAGGWAMFGTQLTAAMSIQKVKDGLWTMEYSGDYGFDAFLDQGGAASDAEMGSYIASFLSHGFWKPDTSSAGGKYGCSALAGKSPTGGALFGRNYDWADCDAMLVHVVPKDGYESVSTCCLDFLGFGEGWKPDGSMADKFMALAAVYVPLDGMNEKGLCVADLMVEPGEVIHQDTDKPDLTTTSALRLLLDRAATVDEAVALLERYDMNFSIDSAHHFAIADASGRSVAVEWIADEMIVTETPVVTNHYLAGDAEPAPEDLPRPLRPSRIRCELLRGFHRDGGGVMEQDELRTMMSSVASSNFNDYRDDGEIRRTQWTLVCDQEALTAQFYRHENWETPFSLALGDGQWFR